MNKHAYSARKFVNAIKEIWQRRRRRERERETHLPCVYTTGRQRRKEKKRTERRFRCFDSMGGTVDSACAAPSIDPSKAASSDLAPNCHLPFRHNVETRSWRLRFFFSRSLSLLRISRVAASVRAYSVYCALYSSPANLWRALRLKATVRYPRGAPSWRTAEGEPISSGKRDCVFLRGEYAKLPCEKRDPIYFLKFQGYVFFARNGSEPAVSRGSLSGAYEREFRFFSRKADETDVFCETSCLSLN